MIKAYKNRSEFHFYIQLNLVCKSERGQWFSI